MGRAQNRHDTQKWKKKRKNHGADKCGNARCTICHPNKVMGIAKLDEIKQNQKLKGENNGNEAKD